MFLNSNRADLDGSRGLKNPVRVLIVEDEVIVAQSIRFKLEDAGYFVTGMPVSGEQALKMAAENKPDIVLMDIKLAGELDGVETAERIRSLYSIPVIFLTAYSSDELLRRARETEPYGYLLKPFNYDELRINLEIALYKAQAEKELRRSEERFRLIADYMYDWEIWLNPARDIIYISPSSERITGYIPDDFMMRPRLIEQITFEEDRLPLNRHINNVFENKDEIGRLDFRIRCKSGELKWMSSVCGWVVSDRGEYFGVRLSNRDITEQKAAEQEREELILELEDSLKNVKKLTGLLPVCSSCKKIRDEKGYWREIEAYLEERTDARFSHGICPECSSRLYPELYVVPGVKKDE